MPRRPPRKYLDPERIQVNPDWLAWREEMIAEHREELPKLIGARGMDPAVYFPEDYDKAIPEDGAWILVLEEPYTELRSRFRVPLLSMWKCRPHELNTGGGSIGVRGMQIHFYPKQAVIATPGGDLHLWPHEYCIVQDPKTLMSMDGVTIHSLGGEPVLDEDQLWYLMSRGIPRDQAVLLLLDQVGTDYIYVTFPEDVTEQLDGVGQPLWRHIQRHPREVESA
jgi:hypothetical protein